MHHFNLILNGTGLLQTGNLKLLRVITLIPAYIADYNLYQPSIKPYSCHAKKKKIWERAIQDLYLWTSIWLDSGNYPKENHFVFKWCLFRSQKHLNGPLAPDDLIHRLVWSIESVTSGSSLNFEDFVSCCYISCQHATLSNSHSCRKIHFNLQSANRKYFFGHDGSWVRWSLRCFFCSKFSGFPI